MSHRQRDQLDFWIHFGCGFLFFGLLTPLLLVQHVDSLGIPTSIAIWLGITTASAILVGFKGDDMWVGLTEGIKEFTRWFYR
jgi:hypothetical protein